MSFKLFEYPTYMHTAMSVSSGLCSREHNSYRYPVLYYFLDSSFSSLDRFLSLKTHTPSIFIDMCVNNKLKESDI